MSGSPHPAWSCEDLSSLRSSLSERLPIGLLRGYGLRRSGALPWGGRRGHLRNAFPQKRRKPGEGDPGFGKVKGREGFGVGFDVFSEVVVYQKPLKRESGVQGIKALGRQYFCW